jgi:transposase
MDVLYARCCGVDVHKKSVVACVLTPSTGATPRQETRTFGTMTADLVALVGWLEERGCTHVAMEATGAYWKPLYNLLEGTLEVLVVNAQHIKAVPGRKTDVNDAQWIATLLRHGLLRASFIPDRDQRELRELTRYRTALIRERAAEVNRLQKTLEGANIKLAGVASDVTGASAREMLAALASGATDAVAMAEYARGRMRAKIPQVQRALEGTVRPHQRFLITQQLAHIDDLDEAIVQVSTEVARRLAPFEDALERLDAIPGVGRHTAEIVLAELGTDMGRFPSPGHLAAWAGLVPGQNESAGKRRSAKTRKGSPWLRAALVEAAHGASRTKDSYLAAQYRRLAARRGAKRAAVAVAHSIIEIMYHLLSSAEGYHDLGLQYFDQRNRQALERRLVGRLERLGFDVSITPKVPAA